jgi:hypothetical protein
MSVLITCLGVGAYADALTRGKQYVLLDADAQKRQVKITTDRGRVRWFPMLLFDMQVGPAPVLAEWQFDESVADEATDMVEVSLLFSDGARRWCWVTTPRYLHTRLEQPRAEPGVWIPHMLVVRCLSPDLVGALLQQIDQQGDLLQASLPFASSEDEDTRDCTALS